MSLESLKKRIQEQIEDDRARRKSERKELETAMGDLILRRSRFQEAASLLMKEVIRPRLDLLAEHLEGISFCTSSDPEKTTVHADVKEHRGASVALEVEISLEEGKQKGTVRSALTPEPALQGFRTKDQTPFAPELPDEGAVERFIEAKVEDFVKAYFQIQRTDPAQPSLETAVDPVCGMRIRKAEAASSLKRKGKDYYFCTNACQTCFEENPTKFTGAGTP